MISKLDVIAAATNLADNGGLENLSLSAVASALGIRTPSLYNHVEGLPGLRRDLAEAGLRQLHRELSVAALGRERDKAVREMSHAYRNFARTHPGLYAATMQTTNGQGEAVAQEVVEVVVAVLKGYGLAHDDTLHAVRGIRSALHGFVALESLGQFAMPLEIDASFDRLVETLIAGLQEAAGLRANS